MLTDLMLIYFNAHPSYVNRFNNNHGVLKIPLDGRSDAKNVSVLGIFKVCYFRLEAVRTHSSGVLANENISVNIIQFMRDRQTVPKYIIHIICIYMHIISI